MVLCKDLVQNNDTFTDQNFPIFQQQPNFFLTHKIYQGDLKLECTATNANGYQISKLVKSFILLLFSAKKGTIDSSSYPLIIVTLRLT